MEEPARKSGLSNWLRDRAVAPPLAVQREKARKLFEALNTLVTQQGGWVISPPGDRHVRIKVPQNSGLIIRLAEAGHKIRFCTTSTHNTGNGVTPTDVFELTLPR
jgi:hypothetical protein